MSPHPAASTAGLLSVAAFAFMVSIAGLSQSAAGAEAEVSKRELRDARTALQEGRWDESRTVYEKALESPLAIDPAIRAESLYVTTLVMLLSPKDESDARVASERLEALETMRGNPYRLETASLRTLLDELSSEKNAYADLERQLAAEQQAREEERIASTVELTSRDEDLAQLRARNRTLRRKAKAQSNEMAALNGAIEAGLAEIAQLEADVDFLTGQLAGTHEDQSRMLEAVMGKNEELRKKERELSSMRLALQRQQTELDTQAEELSDKEEEIRTREEAIREVTERILKKEDPGS